MNHNIHNKIKYIAIALVVSTIINFSSLSVASAAVSTSNLVDLANDSRSQEGLSVLSANSQLESAALDKAQDMFQNQYFAHVSPQGKTPWDFIKTSNYVYVYAGENLAVGFDNPSELHTAWMNSPTHRENIMNPNFREIGLAAVEGTYDGVKTTIVVQMFGSTVATAPVTTKPSTAVTDNSTPVSDPVNLIINKDQTSFSPGKIFEGDKVIFKTKVDGEAKEIYFTVGDQKILLSADLEKKVAINQTGELKVILTAVDSSGKKTSLDVGTLEVVPKVILNAKTFNNQDSKLNLLISFTSDFLKNNLISVSLTTAILTLMLSGYFLFRQKKYGKFI